MAHYNFEDDLPVAIKTEKKVARLLQNKYAATNIKFCKDNKYDILAFINGRLWSFEVKEDFMCEKTGNVGVEFECWGAPSGIQTSAARFYIYVIHRPDGIHVVLFKTQSIKNMIAREEYHTIVSGGDEGSRSMNYLFDYDIFISHGKEISYQEFPR